jgi:peptidyl-prolyl cis-trans isomerase SDCCAG10
VKQKWLCGLTVIFIFIAIVYRNVALLSFADDAPDMTMDEVSNSNNQEDSKRKKKMLSSHDLLEDDPTLSRDTDHKLVSEIRDSSSSSSKRKASNEDNGEEGQDGIQVDDTNESLNAYDQRMRDQVREKLKRAKLAKESSSSTASANVDSMTKSSSLAPSTPSKLSTAPETLLPVPTVAEPVLSAGDRVRQEILKLEGDIRKMHSRDSDREAAEAARKKGKGSKVSLLQLEREQYKTRAESKGGDSRKKSRAALNAEKERELLDKLSAFETKVFAMAREPEPNPAPKKNDAPPCEIHGIPSCESCQDNTVSKKMKQSELAHSDDEPVAEDSDDDIGWMQHKLVFEKDLKGKDVSLASKRDDANEYIVIDPLNKAASTTAALVVEKQRNLEKFKRTHQQQDNGKDRKPYGGSSSGGGSYGRSSRDSSSSYQRRDDHQSRYGYNRDSRESRDSRDSRDQGHRDNRDSRDVRDSRDRRDHRDSRDSRESRDRRDRR